MYSNWHDTDPIKYQFLSLFSAHLGRGNCPRDIRLLPEGSGVENASTLWHATEGRQKVTFEVLLSRLCVSGAVS